MSDKTDIIYPTTDPILLAALLGSPQDVPATRGSSQYGGVSKNKNKRSTTWSASISWGPKSTGNSYSLGTYATEEEAGLARNYADELLKRPNPVGNQIPPDKMPDEATRKRVAATVVHCLRAKGALPANPTAPTPPVQAPPAVPNPTAIKKKPAL